MVNNYKTPYENAEKFGMKVNPKAIHVANVMKKLSYNEEKYGEPYCPCYPTRSEDTICPCKFMRTKKACRCGLYVKGDN